MNVGICREDCGRVDQLVHQLNVHSKKLQHYQHASMIDYHEFKLKNYHNNQYKTLLKQIKKNGPRITGITSMDFCLSTPTTAPGGDTIDEMYVLKILSYLFPSLRELDLTNTCSHNCEETFFQNCSRLEKVTANSIMLDARGTKMKAANNLRELYMDNVLFFVTGSDIDAISDLDTEDEVVSKTFLFHACSSKVLERVSMRNTKDPTILG